MGLDMYLTAEKYFYREEDTKYVEILKSLGIPLTKNMKPKSVTFEAMYWRKANQIHSWFVKNVQSGKDDCGEYPVSTLQLKDLLKVCEQVLENRALALQLLPSTSGFFFGSTEYDQSYYDDIEHTVNTLKQIFELYNVEDCVYFNYRASW